MLVNVNLSLELIKAMISMRITINCLKDHDDYNILINLKMEQLIWKIASYRKLICPRSSYESSNELLLIIDDINHDYRSISKALQSTKEFNQIKTLRYTDIDDESSIFNSVNNQVIVAFNSDQDTLNKITNLVLSHKTTLVFGANFLNPNHDKILYHTLKSVYNSDSSLTILYDDFTPYTLITIHKNLSTNNDTSNLSTITTINPEDLIGNYGHPSVLSKQQFKYLWSDPTAIDGRRRVLQRLSKQAIELNNKSYNIKPEYINEVIHNAVITKGYDDKYVYNLLRTIYKGKQLVNNAPATYTIPKNMLIEIKPWDDENGDGRSDFMVKRLLECLPTSLSLSPSFTTAGAGAGGKVNPIKTVLDYGCAEGAITSKLREQLKVPVEQCYGCDVRLLDSDGFTFLSLPKEDEQPPEVGTILPQIPSSSVDLVTASMVFHHVKHLDAVILELRRVISPTGCLILREHDCLSSSEAMFLDITHGLYSLVLSDPIEWPAFLEEYKAWYRSREQWNEVLKRNRFVRIEMVNPMADRHYNAAVVRPTSIKSSDPCANLTMPNLVKAYYAVYKPSETSKLISFDTFRASSTTTHTAHTTNASNSIEPMAKRARIDTTTASLDPLSSSSSQRLPQADLGITAPSTTNTAPAADDMPGFTVFESSSHRGHYFVLDEQNKPHWVTLTLPTSTASAAASALVSNIQRESPHETFIHPVSKLLCKVTSKVAAIPK